MITVDRSRPTALAQQIREQITWAISTGALSPGAELPPVRALAAELGVNLHTVRGAYQRLAEDGLVEVRRGSRTRVAAFDPGRLWSGGTTPSTHLVGIVLPTLSNPFYGELLEGAQEVARRSGSLLVVATTEDEQPRALRAVAQFAAQGVDGVIAVSTEVARLFSDSRGDLVGGPRRLPLVVVDRPGVPGHAVDVDLEAAGYLATRHLIDHGHRDIGLITLAAMTSNVVPFEDGHRRALREAAPAPTAGRLVRVAGWGVDDGDVGATRLLSAPDRPTAIVAISDVVALGVMRAAKRLGLDIPDDVALVGVDDIPLIDALNPPLTSVALPARAMGAEAMVTLEHIWAGDAVAPRRTVLRPHLVIRESCGAHAPR